MARQEHEREDLLREATALVQRIALLADDSTAVVVGFRGDGSGSIYVGDDLAYHFNSENELRRAYVDGELLKAEGGGLIALRRQRTKREVQLLRRSLDPTQSAKHLERLAQCVRWLGRLCHSSDLRILGQVPEQTDVLQRVREWLDKLDGQLRIASRPHAE